MNHALREAHDTVIRLFDEGVSFGHFEMTITVETENSRRRRVIVNAGKKHKFLIPEDQVTP